MADSTSVADEVTAPPAAARIARAEAFTRESFLHDGEDPVTALAAGSARRRALDAALAEIDAGLDAPSTKWRRRYSLLLGLERVLSDKEPRLADGTSLNPHQVDALAGTLTALLARAQRGDTRGDEDDDLEPSAAPVFAIDEEEDAEAVAEALALDAEVAHFEIDDDFALDDEEDDDGSADHDDESDSDAPEGEVDEDIDDALVDDPNASKRFWFEHATGAGKTVAAMGFVDASRTGGVLILTHRRNLVDQFLGELRTRGYGDRESPPLLDGEGMTRADGPVTVETYQWFVRNAGRISPAYTIVICDEAHTALGEKTSAAIREWTGPVFVGMTATGALIARHVTDLFPTQTSRFDLAQAARRGVIAPLRCLRIPPGTGVRNIAKVPLRKGDVDVEFDQEMLAELLDQLPFNLAIANLYKTRFNGVPGVVYAAGVRHAYNVAEAFRDEGIKAEAVSGETPKRELAEILARYERGDIDVLVNAQLLAEGWNSPRATVCMHLAPTASKRIYQQRVGRVTRRHPGKEAGVVVDFVHPATRHDDPVVTLHSLLDRDVYRGGAIVVGPVRRGRGRRVRVERRVIPVCAQEEERHEVFERELWRIAVEHLDWGEQHMWAALAGARVAPSGWRRARAMLHFDKTGELKSRFLITAVERNRNAQLRIRALQEIAAARDPEAFDRGHDVVGTWPRDERREGTKVLLQALSEKRIGRRDQANAWIWRLAEYTRELHEEYAVQRWPETKRLLGLLVNSSGGAHARNARRLVQAAKNKDRRLSAAILAAAVAHTPEAESVLRDARTRMARKPSALSRELLRNFPKAKRGRRRRKRKGGGGEAEQAGAQNPQATGVEAAETSGTQASTSSRSRSRNRSRRRAGGNGADANGVDAVEVDIAAEIAGAAALLPSRAGAGPDEKVLDEALAAAPDVTEAPDLDDAQRAAIDERVEDVLGDAPAAPVRPTRRRKATPVAPGDVTDPGPGATPSRTPVVQDSDDVEAWSPPVDIATDSDRATRKASARAKRASRAKTSAGGKTKAKGNATAGRRTPAKPPADDEVEPTPTPARRSRRAPATPVPAAAVDPAPDAPAPDVAAEALRAKRSAAAKKAAATRKANAERRAAELAAAAGADGDPE